MSRDKVLFVCLFLCVIPACKKLPYVPDETATISLSVVPATITSGETARVTVTGLKESGYPLPDGTLVYLSVDNGHIDSEVILSGGAAETLYQSQEDYAGPVTVTARSGNAQSEAVTITVEAVLVPDVEFLYISAETTHLEAGGGRSVIKVQAMDENMLPMAGKNIWISTTAGTLSGGGLYVTGADGSVEVTLNTDQTAVVTANYKDKSATVTVTVEETE